METVLFAEVVATTQAVAATRSRSSKIAALTDLLTRAAPEEVPVISALLLGAPRQGRIGIGWRTVAEIDVAPAAAPTLTVSDIDAGLARLDALRGPGSQAARAGELRRMSALATADEQDLLGRLLVGELRHGALAGVVTDAVAKAADVPFALMRRAAMLAGDLPEVATVALTSGAAGLDAIGLTIGRPVQPMLAQTSGDVTEALTQATSGDPARMASIEWKLDGARIQVHRNDNDVHIFTRNLNDVTARLGGIADLARTFPAGRFVLDGEAVGWDGSEEAAPQAFQETMSRFGSHDGAAGAGLDARFFDLLHLDGEDLIDQPLTERLSLLGDLVGPWQVTGRLTDDPVIGAQVLAESLAAGHEGVMIKDAASRYDAGRRGGAWRKVKPVHTLDLVVLAVEWGRGRRQGWLSNLHLGARGPDGFVMVGKTFKGLTDDLLTWQTERFLALETGRSGHIVHVRPEQVVEIALDGAQASARYPGGVALRFARVRRYRTDKRPEDADTIDAVRALLPGTHRAW